MTRTQSAVSQSVAEAHARAAFHLLAGQIETILLEHGWTPTVRDGEPVPFVQAHGDLVILRGDDAHGINHSAASKQGLSLAQYLAALDLRPRVPRPTAVDSTHPASPRSDPRGAELAALRERVAELEGALAEAQTPAPPLLPEPDALLADYGPTGDDVTGDMLLNAFEHDETETAAVVQTLSATRLRHLSEQLNVERARLDREHQLTGFANPRAASIDRLIGLLTRRGEV